MMNTKCLSVQIKCQVETIEADSTHQLTMMKSRYLLWEMNLAAVTLYFTKEMLSSKECARHTDPTMRYSIHLYSGKARTVTTFVYPNVIHQLVSRCLIKRCQQCSFTLTE